MIIEVTTITTYVRKCQEIMRSLFHIEVERRKINGNKVPYQGNKKVKEKDV